MSTKPILFNSEMVRAILDGRKTQTRREVKARKGWPIDFVGGAGDINDPSCWGFENPEYGEWFFLEPDGHGHKIPNPYGEVGDLLWVRETWKEGFTYGGEYPAVFYRATGDGYIGSEDYPPSDVSAGKFGVAKPGPYCSAPHVIKWKPSIHMPRWASRLTLEITNVRVERLQDISKSDAEAEGFKLPPAEGQGFAIGARTNFRHTWQSIYQNWDANPWVWVIEFKVHHCNVDAFIAQREAA